MAIDGHGFQHIKQRTNTVNIVVGLSWMRTLYYLS